MKKHQIGSFGLSLVISLCLFAVVIYVAMPVVACRFAWLDMYKAVKEINKPGGEEILKIQEKKMFTLCRVAST